MYVCCYISEPAKHTRIVPNQKDVQVQLMSQEQGRRQNVGLSLWVSTGIKLQETQSGHSSHFDQIVHKHRF